MIILTAFLLKFYGARLGIEDAPPSGTSTMTSITSPRYSSDSPVLLATGLTARARFSHGRIRARCCCRGRPLTERRSSSRPATTASPRTPVTAQPIRP